MLNEIFCFNNIKGDILKTDHWKNVSYCVSSLNSNFFHSEWRNFDKTDMRFLNTGISRMIFYTNILRFEIVYFFNLTHAWGACSKSLLKGKDQYDWHPCTYYIKLAATANTERTFLWNKEVNCTEPSPSVRVPWCCKGWPLAYFAWHQWRNKI